MGPQQLGARTSPLGISKSRPPIVNPGWTQNDNLLQKVSVNNAALNAAVTKRSRLLTPPVQRSPGLIRNHVKRTRKQIAHLHQPMRIPFCFPQYRRQTKTNIENRKPRLRHHREHPFALYGNGTSTAYAVRGETATSNASSGNMTLTSLYSPKLRRTNGVPTKCRTSAANCWHGVMSPATGIGT